MLRPAVAREAYDTLGLGEWQLAQLRREYPDDRWAGVAAVGRDDWIAERMEQRWRSAADCEELHRLWVGAVGSGLILLEGKRASFSGEGAPDAERWVSIGVQAAVALAEAAQVNPFRFSVLLFALMESYVGRCAAVSKRSMLDFIIDWHWGESEQSEWDEIDTGWRERHYEPRVEEVAGMWADTVSTSRTRTPSP